MDDYPLHAIPKPCYVFDIDGTLADLTHRRHHVENKPKNWPAFHAGCVDDKPIEHICALARTLQTMTEQQRHIEQMLWTLDFIRRECGLLRNPLETIRESSIKIIEEMCAAEIARVKAGERG